MIIGAAAQKEKIFALLILPYIFRQEIKAFFSVKTKNIALFLYIGAESFNAFGDASLTGAYFAQALYGFQHFYIADIFAVHIAGAAHSAGIEDIFKPLTDFQPACEYFLGYIEKPLTGIGVKAVVTVDGAYFSKVPAAHFGRQYPFALSAMVAGVH